VKRRAIPGILFFAAIGWLCSAAIASAESLAPAPYVEWGKEIFAQRCASCHGSDGKGGGAVAGELKTAPADLTQLAKKNGGKFPRSRVTAAIDGEVAVATHGPREMPIWGRILREEIGRPYGAAGARAEIQALTDALESMQAP
jgi:mono/diheme cytochrome c family protein